MHGFDLSDEDRRLLRSRPPERALRWCAAAVGASASVVAVKPLAGGTSSAIHAIDVQDAGGLIHRLVLRRFVRTDWLAQEPDLAEHEACALALAAAAAVPTPSPVGVDPNGGQCDAPAVLMTRLPGSIQWQPADREPFLRKLAAALPAIHGTEVDVAGCPLPDYAPYPLQAQRPPTWSHRPELWKRAFELFASAAPVTERCLIHRDYHPGNVLWSDGEITGVVDWVNASIGCPEADVGHCRMNLARADSTPPPASWSSTANSADPSPMTPTWDVAALLGGRDQPDVERLTPADEEFLASALRSAR
jgi:aminoglycoside phosphotransferase (APT) family kinase protein